MHYSDMPARVKSPAMGWMVLFIETLNLCLAAALLWRGFNFWPDNPQGADVPTVIASVIVIVLASLWGVYALKEYYGFADRPLDFRRVKPPSER